jgi:hypothetical protein
MSDIASSIGKVKGLTENFGMGGKVASLPSNPLGIRYRSCAGGLASEIVIGKFDGVYGRQLRRAVDGQMTDVLDVTHAYDADRLADDWTEVVLLGSAADQDTARDPYAGDPYAQNFWIPETIYHRFLRFPPNVTIEIAEGLQWFDSARRFETIAERWSGAFQRHAAVETISGVTVHYLFDPAHPQRPWENASSEDSLQTSRSFAAVAYRNELYDLRLGSHWIYDSPKYGLSFGGRHISIIVELPDDYPVVPDTYRQFLRHASGEQANVEFAHFAREVKESLPQWLTDMMDNLARSATPSADLTLDLSQFRKTLGVLLYKHVGYAAGEEPSEEVLRGWREPELSIIQLQDVQDVRDRWLEGRAGCFYPETNQLFVNCRYEAVASLAGELGRMAQRDGAISSQAGGFDDALLHAVACEAIVRRLARSIFYGLAKTADPEHWQQGHIEKSISPEALTIVADEWRDLVPGAMDALRHRIGLFAPPSADFHPGGALTPKPNMVGGEAQTRLRFRKVSDPV